MSIKQKLLRLREAAQSIDRVTDTSAVLQLVQTKPYDQLFFSEITDPRWLPHLEAGGFFSSLPSPISDEVGTRYPRHAPLFALKRLASAAAEQVVNILEGLELPENPAVCDQVIQVIAATADRRFCKRLLWTLQRTMESQENPDFLWIGDILSNWLAVGEFLTCIAGLRTILAVAGESIDRGHPPHNWQASRIDREVLAPLGGKHPLELAEVLVDTLVSWARRNRGVNEEDRSNRASQRLHPDTGPRYAHPNTFWLRSFGGAAFGTNELEITIANRLHSIGVDLLKKSTSDSFGRFDDLLRQDRWHLFQRLRWKLYAECPEKTLALARAEALERLPLLCLEDMVHEREFALMLEKQCEEHGVAFLTPSDTRMFIESVLKGPLERGSGKVDLDFRANFHSMQLYPIRRLLQDVDPIRYQDLIGERNFRDAYGPPAMRGMSGPVESVSPAQAEHMSDMDDPTLWQFLNTWNSNQTGRWTEGVFEQENLSGLAAHFARFVETNPHRFEPSSEWWKNLLRPALLQRFLEVATKRITEVTEKGGDGASIDAHEWELWFGISSWIVAQNDEDEPKSENWNYPRVIAARFLAAVIESRPSPAFSFLSSVEAQLRQLVEGFDSRLDANSESFMGDWLTTGINSVRGTAVEALLSFGHYQKNRGEAGGIDAWIFDVLASRLRDGSESPAVFAVCGARLRLLLHLFEDSVAVDPQLLLPQGQAAQRTAFLKAHFTYDNPGTGILRVLPQLPDEALNLLALLTDDDGEQHDGREYGSRLGTHLAFYYWNAAFSEQAVADAIMDRFFEVASAVTRTSTIEEIGRIFVPVQGKEETCTLFERVMRIWDRRFSQIEFAIEAGANSEDFTELSAFAQWLGCECLPFAWRVDRLLKAIRLVRTVPLAFSLIETLAEFTSTGEKVDEAMKILRALVEKPDDELRWSYDERLLTPLLERGLSASEESIRESAEAVQEALLQKGLFAYLDIPAENVSLPNLSTG